MLRVICRFHTDPSGTFVTYEAKAIGSGSEGAQSTLQVNLWMHNNLVHGALCGVPSRSMPNASDLR